MLKLTVQKLYAVKIVVSSWVTFTAKTNYSDSAIKTKKEFQERFLKSLKSFKVNAQKRFLKNNHTKYFQTDTLYNWQTLQNIRLHQLTEESHIFRESVLSHPLCYLNPILNNVRVQQRQTLSWNQWIIRMTYVHLLILPHCGR